MSTRYVLIDYQNVQPTRSSPTSRDRLWVFLGSKQSEATARKRLGNDARYIKISGEGHNALDFHIAFYIGELLSREPDCHVWIVSKDKGFRYLVEHLTSRKFHVRQVPDLWLVQPTAATVSNQPSDAPTIDPGQLNAIASYLEDPRASARPRKIRTLYNVLRSFLTKRPTAAEIRAYADELQRQHVVAFEDQKVSYAPDKRT